ncbi:RNA polymerase subunit sigma [Rhodanobacter thiooxydans]|uniref:RNA polymerase sigma factor n=1 Tax=Rhodanobacter thiooxydans TaxID=416169 RepID=A0A154QKV3_9GAMM|nr:RNA polymerase sigma factor [Rhodanobacter thiooxydans]EIL97941.1 RNA polymerase sigma-70 factor,ECF subfamily protein [Rhodanobacter thiooxydans LCS2]KZC24849.1 RNA polymerase subunit sigma [Rhodanobacter thiooxydans]MCW0203087.1 RNA polymerase sigma factor [Rhodanobacter thiooxydans]
MSAHAHAVPVDYAALDDHALVTLVRAGHREAFRHIMQRCNQRLYRVARAVIGEDSEAEDVLQESYMRAYDKLDSFRGDSTLLTWLTSIVLNEARGRLRKRHTMVGLEQVDAAPDDTHQIVQFPSKFGSEDPAAAAARMQIRHLLEDAIDELPRAFRTVYMMREVEECSVEETASLLTIKPETVKTRLHRARRLLRTSLQGSLAGTMGEVFPFMGQRCARVADAVMARLEAEQST